MKIIAAKPLIVFLGVSVAAVVIGLCSALMIAMVVH